MSSKRIRSTDPYYADILASWIENNRSSQFDRQGSFGWAAYRVRKEALTEDEPDFYQFASTLPTVTDDRGNVTEKGVLAVNEDGFRVRIDIDRRGIPTFTMIEPPNEL